MYVAAEAANSGTTAAKDCWRCNNTFPPKGQHGPQQCKAKKYTCNACGQRGHVKAGCERAKALKSAEADESATEKTKGGQSEMATLAAVLQRLDARLEKIENAMSSQVQGTSGLAITDKSGVGASSGSYEELQDNEKIEFGGIIF